MGDGGKGGLDVGNFLSYLVGKTANLHLTMTINPMQNVMHCISQNFSVFAQFTTERLKIPTNINGEW